MSVDVRAHPLRDANKRAGGQRPDARKGEPGGIRAAGWLVPASSGDCGRPRPARQRARRSSRAGVYRRGFEATAPRTNAGTSRLKVRSARQGPRQMSPGYEPIAETAKPRSKHETGEAHPPASRLKLPWQTRSSCRLSWNASRRAPSPSSHAELPALSPAVGTRAGAWLDSRAKMVSSSRPGKAPSEAARVLAGRRDVSGGGFGDRAAAPRNLMARVESSLRDHGPSTTVRSVAALDSTPNGVRGALGKANVACEDGRYRLADDE